MHHVVLGIDSADEVKRQQGETRIDATGACGDERSLVLVLESDRKIIAIHQAFQKRPYKAAACAAKRVQSRNQ